MDLLELGRQRGFVVVKIVKLRLTRRDKRF